MKRSIIWDKTKSAGTKLLAAIFWVAVWQLLYRLVARDILVASPAQVVRRLGILAWESSFWTSVGGTMWRVLEGYLLALLTGGLLAVLTVRSRLLHTLFSPLLGVIKSTPVASFIILALIWLSSGRVPVLIAYVMVVPVVWANLCAGLENIDRELLEMAHVFRFSRWKKVRLIHIPGIMPYFVAACTTGLGAAWKSVIAAEVISHPKNSLGIQIYNARLYLDTTSLFAWTLTVIVLSIVLEKLAVYLLGRVQQRLLTVSRLPGGR